MRLQNVQTATEAFLTRRKRRARLRKEKRKKKNVIVDWIEAILWAVLVVLIINQYLLQAYMIPSGSMETTLMPGDRIFVNKVIFGPELIPGHIKLPGYAEPRRGQIVIFENPTYIGNGPWFDILQRVLYMITLSFVDIDRNSQGKVRAHFLIKRVIGVGGDRLRVENGSMFLKPEGEAGWMSEADFKKLSGLHYTTRRLLTPSDYTIFREAARAEADKEAGLPLTSSENAATQKLSSLPLIDGKQFEKDRLKDSLAISPQSRLFASGYERHVLGWWIPPTRIFPMGDNRDNSEDARYFGAVRLKKVLGKAMFRYWPPSRIGGFQ